MPAEQFSLTWDNFHKNMSSGLQTLLQSEALVDVTLAVDGQYIKAHKMILSVCSPYFQTLFEVNPCKHPIVLMKDVTYSAMTSLLQFMYFGEVQVNQDDLASFIKTAEALQIKGLTGSSGNAESESHDIKVPVERELVSQRSSRNSVAPQSSSIQTKKKATVTPPAPKRHKPNPATPAVPAKKQSAENAVTTFKVEPMVEEPKHTVDDDDGDDGPDSGDFGGDDNNDDMEDFNLSQSGMDMVQTQPGTSGGDDTNQGMVPHYTVRDTYDTYDQRPSLLFAPQVSYPHAILPPAPGLQMPSPVASYAHNRYYRPPPAGMRMPPSVVRPRVSAPNYAVNSYKSYNQRYTAKGAPKKTSYKPSANRNNNPPANRNYNPPANRNNNPPANRNNNPPAKRNNPPNQKTRRNASTQTLRGSKHWWQEARRTEMRQNAKKAALIKARSENTPREILPLLSLQ